MNIKKRIVPIVLFFAFIASSIAVGQCSVSAAADTAGPAFQSVSVNGSVVSGGGSVTASVSATDDSSGVKSGEIWYVSPTGYTLNHAALSMDAGVLKGTLSINKYSETGYWKVDHIDLYDNAGNMSTVCNSENNMFGNLIDLSLGDYYVSGAMTEHGLPVLQGIALDKKSAGPGTSINMTINATDSESGINYAFVLYTSPSGMASKYSLIYPDSTGALKDTLDIGQYDEAGTWTVDSIEVCDNAGNMLDLYNSEVYAEYGDPTLTLRDLSSGDFTIAGTTVDSTAPAFQSISVDKSTMWKGGNVTLTLNATDTQAGIDYAVVVYSSPWETSSNFAILYPDANGNLKTTIPMSEYNELGTWKVDTILIFDKIGNYIDIYNSQIYSDPYITKLYLGAGNFTVVEKLSQAVPEGLTGVPVTSHGGADGKITGTSAGMEYKKEYAADYTPVEGTEITGLSEGKYYVRYAESEAYHAGPATAVVVKGPEFDVDKGVLLKYNGAGGDVVIPDNLGITSIGDSAFFQCYSVSSLTIPDGVTSIGKNAFYYCENLKSIKIPESTTSIGSGAFWACKTLQNITLPSGITTISDDMFTMCYLLSSLNIPDKVTSIGSGAFSGCALTSINIPASVKSIGTAAFRSCNMTTIAIPDGITSLSDYLFCDCRELMNVTMPNSVTSIGSNTFGNCISLSSINLPDSITSIAGSAFSGSGLTSMTIPNGFTTLNDHMFRGCPNLKSVTLPEGLKSIGAGAFQESGLTSIEIPSSVTAIGFGAFMSCTNLTSIEIPAGVTIIESSTFDECSKLANVSMPNGITKIGYDAFSWCSSLASLTIPSSVKEIGDGAFAGCSKLTTINSCPITAPTTVSNLFFSIPLEAQIYIVPGSVGYNVQPWSNRTQYVMSPPAIEVTTPPRKTDYYTGQSLNLTGIIVNGIFSETKAQVPVTMANISGFNSSTPSAGQKVTVTVNGKTATFEVNIIDKAFAPPSTGNMAKGKTITSSAAFTSGSYATDGNATSTNYYTDITNPYLQWVQVDLGAAKNINEINLWHYFGDSRSYHDVIVQISDDPTFATGVKTVYNNDRDNSAKLGTGTDYEYKETSTGLNIALNAIKGKYVRFYSNGSTANGSNHYVEIEIYGELPIVPAASVSLDKATAKVETYSTYSLAATVLPADTTNKSVTWSSSDASVATVSANGVVTGVKAGTATITATTVDGQYKSSCDFTVIAAAKNLSNGKQFTSNVFNGISSITDGSKSLSSMADDYPNGGGLQYVQMDLGAYYDLSKINLWHYYGDGRKYKDVIVQVSNDPTFVTDVTTVYNNDSNNSAGFGIGTDAEYAEISAGKTITIDMVNARYVRLYSNGSDKNTSNHYVEAEIYGFVGPIVNPASLTLDKATAALAVGATSALTAKVMPLNTTDKSVTWSSSNAGVAAVSATGAVTGVAAGKATITAATADGKLSASCEVTVTLEPGNLSAGKLFTSPVFKDLARVTDGSKSTGSFAEDYPNGGGLQYMQLDLGAYYDLSNIKLWHYYGDGRKYKDVIVQISNDPTFATDVTTVYSNDTDNSAKLGTGTKAEYAETSAGLNIPLDAVNVRYVRLYSNGSNLNSSNHYVEVEVYGLKGAAVHPSAVTLSKSTMKVVEGATDSLSATVMPLNTTDKSVKWSSSDESVAKVSAVGLVTGVKAGTATITATTVDGSVKADCAVTVSSAPLSAGKQCTSSVFTGLSKITDGSKSTGSFAEDYPNGGGLQYVQMDLGAYYDLSDIKLWHYYGDGRKYKDVIVQVSNDPNFATDVTTVYSNDTDNSAKLGTGTKTEYAETSAGLDIPFDAVNARYVRFYSNGSDKNASNHYVEAEVYGAKGAAVHPVSVSLSKTTYTLINEESYTLSAKVMPLNTTDKSVTWSSSDVNVASVSDSGMVVGINAGTATITAKTADGSLTASCKVTVEPTTNTNLTAGKVFTSPVFKDMERINDGNRSTGSFSEDYPLGGGLQYVQVDLGDSYYLTDIRLWHYYGDGRKYKDVVVLVSNDPTFKTGVKTIYNNDSDNSAGRGAGTNSEYAETSSGLDMYAAVSGRYVRFYSNGSTANSNNHYAEIEISGLKANLAENQAAGKTMTSSVNFANLPRVADGIKSTGSFAEDYPLGGGLQWVQADLGISYDISDIRLWHYFGDSRTYHDVVVQVSDDPTFKTDVTTVYNNDADGSAGLGLGTDREYAETSSGLYIPVPSVNGRYVRFYSNGSTANSNNHYVELEVYGK